MGNAHREDMLLSQIEDLEKEIDALIPAWEVPGLKLSYLNSEVLSALLRLY